MKFTKEFYLRNPNNILIVQTAFLGDLILTTPLIRETKNLFPSSNLFVVALPQYAGVLKNNPHIKEIIPFDKRNAKLKELIKTSKRLKELKIDLAITPHRSFTTSVLLFLAKPKFIIGFKSNLLTIFYDKAISYPDEGLTIAKNLKLLSPIEDKKYEISTELFPSAEDFSRVKRILMEANFDLDKPFISIAPGSVWETKKWKKEYYAELIAKLSEKKYNLILIGDKNEQSLCDEILRQANVTALNVAGKTSLLESAALISLCDLTICNDSGALHLANAMETDVFAFFGPTVKNFGFYPYRENDKVFEVELECRPCSSHGGNKCPLKHHNCMKLILPDFVLKEVESKFENFKESKAKRILFS